MTVLVSTLRATGVGGRRDGTLFAPEPGAQLIVGDSAYVFCHVDDVNRTIEVVGKKENRQDRVVIVGGGNVGLEAAKALEAKTGRIRAKIIEKSRKCAERAAETLERTIVLHGDGLDRSLMIEAGIGRADAMLAVTDDDKTNMLAAVRAKSEGCPFVVALINDPTLLPLMSHLGIDAYINPRSTTVSSILQHIRYGRVRQVYSIGDAEAEVIEAEVMGTTPLAGQAVRDIPFPEGVLVGRVRKGGVMLPPSGTLRIDEGDVIALFAMAADVPEVERLMQVSIDYF